MFYFAYASSLDCRQIIERCPKVRFYCVARLDNYTLAFTRRSQGRQCGVADIVPSEGSTVWGVVYELDSDDLDSLDRSEGYRPGREQNSYNRVERQVIQRDNSSPYITVWTYVATRQPSPPKPNAAYKRQIVDGARFWRFPADYIAKLEAIQTEG